MFALFSPFLEMGWLSPASRGPLRQDKANLLIFLVSALFRLLFVVLFSRAGRRVAGLRPQAFGAAEIPGEPGLHKPSVSWSGWGRAAGALAQPQGKEAAFLPDACFCLSLEHKLGHRSAAVRPARLSMTAGDGGWAAPKLIQPNFNPLCSGAGQDGAMVGTFFTGYLR